MNKCNCNKPKCEPSKCRTDGFVFRKVVIPAQLGDDITGQDKPENGAMTNSFVTYEANGAQYIYDSFGVYTKFNGGEATVPVLSVNGKIGNVILTTSDLENDSDYVTGTYVDEAISEEATLREGEDERIERKVDDVADDLEAESTARSDADRQLILDLGDETTARQGADNSLQGQIDAITASSDVTDIVGTYAELQAYDTSTLGDKDIIKVLQDESQNDETTYYRWSTATQTFTLIGEEGPYYTKSAADAKFQDKLTAGANITIGANNEISATDTTYTAGANIQITGTTISATDTTYSDFTGTDGTASGTSGLVPAPSALDIDKYLKSDGTWDTVAAGPTVVQTIGTSTTDVMSQVAVSGLIYPTDQLSVLSKNICIGGGTARSASDNIAIGREASIPYGDSNIAIGFHAQITGFSRNYSTAIGRYSNVSTDWGTAIGAGAQASSQYSTSLGDHSRTSRQYEVSIGSGQAGDAATYKERYLANVKDPSLAQDAATKNYVDTVAVGTEESLTIATTDWTVLSGASPYDYSATVTVATTIGANSTVELVNDQAVLFGTYGFAIGAISGQDVTIYSIGQPDASVTLTIKVRS